MMDRVRILSICDDDGLRASRELLLMNEGYETESAPSSEALAVCDSKTFDIALICRSVEADQAVALAQALRRCHPEIHIITIETIDERSETCNPDVQVSSGPALLLGAIRELCSQRASPRKDWYEVSHRG